MENTESFETTYDVVITNISSAKLTAIQAVREILGVDISYAEHIINEASVNLPYTFKSSISKAEAISIVSIFDHNGVEAIINPKELSITTQQSPITKPTSKNENPSKNSIKMIKCEMCGSNNLLKEDGVFVCQSCGTKYSVDEAKKLMSGDTIKIDNTPQIENFYKMAKNYVQSNMLDDAAKYCDKIFEIDAENYLTWKLKIEIDIRRLTWACQEYIKVSGCRDRVSEVDKMIAKLNNTMIHSAKSAFSCADDREKNDLLNYMIKLSSIYLGPFKTTETVFFPKYYMFIEYQQNAVFHFINSNYDEEKSALFMDKYFEKVIKKIKDDEHLRCALDNISKHMKKNKFVTKRSELNAKLEEIRTRLSHEEKETKIKFIIKDMRYCIDSMQRADNKVSIDKYSSKYNEQKNKLAQIYKPNIDISEDLKRESQELLNTDIMQYAKKGCYVATCVYGSYDCPQVWTLRRFRDYTLSETWYGRAFIKIYYAISPTLVKWFGNTNWFKGLWKKPLDKMVEILNKQGFEDTKYNDKM